MDIRIKAWDRVEGGLYNVSVINYEKRWVELWEYGLGEIVRDFNDVIFLEQTPFKDMYGSPIYYLDDLEITSEHTIYKNCVVHESTTEGWLVFHGHINFEPLENYVNNPEYKVKLIGRFNGGTNEKQKL